MWKWSLSFFYWSNPRGLVRGLVPPLPVDQFTNWCQYFPGRIREWRFLKSSVGLLWQTRLSLRGIPDPDLLRIHHAPPSHQTFFLPTGWTIRSLLSGPGSGGCKGSGEWARSHWIIPLFQLLWPGMPNFTARFSSLCVNQSFAREPRRPQSPPPSPHDLSPPRTRTRSYRSVLRLLPPEVLFETTFLSYLRIKRGEEGIDVPNVSPRVRISTKIYRVKIDPTRWSTLPAWERIPREPAEAILGLIISPVTKFIFHQNVNQTIRDQVSRYSRGEGGWGGVRGRFVNGRRFIRYSSYAMTRPCTQPIRWSLETSATPRLNQWRII